MFGISKCKTVRRIKLKYLFPAVNIKNGANLKLRVFLTYPVDDKTNYKCVCAGVIPALYLYFVP